MAGKIRVHYLYPFDLGMDLDLGLNHNRYNKEVLRKPDAGQVFFEGESLGPATLVADLYPFGIGMIDLSFNFPSDLTEASDLAVSNEKVRVGKYALPVYLLGQIDETLAKARPYSRSAGVERLEPSHEIFNLLMLTPWQEDLEAESFLKKNRKTLFGIVTGEPSYARLSDYALEKEKLKNIGYYDGEIILVNRYGAFLHSREEETLKDLLSLALAQHFNARAANAFLERALGRAQKILESQPPYTRFWKIPAAYERLSRERTEFDKAKVALVESLHTVHTQIPHIESDWHLKSVHRELLDAFELEEQTKTAMVRLETIDSIYAHLAEQISTVFFIFLDFVFLAWLFVDLISWSILITIEWKKL